MEWMEPEEFGMWRRWLEVERRCGNLTPARRDCLRALLCFYGTEGLWPSDAAVAELVGHGIATVRRARRDARERGGLTWERKRKLMDGRWVQGVNVYAIHLPSPLACSGDQKERGRQGRKEEAKKEREQTVPMMPVAAARAALEVVARRRLTEFQARYAHRIPG